MANDNDLIDIEPETLRDVEFMQARELLTGMVGRRVESVAVEETRIAVRTDDGKAYYFYGFMGEEAPEGPAS